MPPRGRARGSAIVSPPIVERGDEMWYQYTVLGMSQREIAEQHGYAQQRVSQVIADVAKNMPKPDLDATRNRRLAMLDRAIRVAMQRYDAGDRAEGHDLRAL